MSEPITKDVIAGAVDVAIESTAHLPADKQAESAKAIVLSDPVIQRATTPVSRFASQTIQGIAAAGAAQLLEATGIVKSLVITAGWFGATWKPDEVSAVLTTVITLAGLGWAWYGRETTTRPLA